jgi:hypothetical protein
LQISKIETIEGIVANSKRVKPIIAIGRVILIFFLFLNFQLLKESAIPRQEIPYTPPHHKPDLHIKVIEFHRFMDLILWEIRSQLLAVKTEVAKATELTSLVTFAHVLRDVKQIMVNGREDDEIPKAEPKTPELPKPEPTKTPEPLPSIVLSPPQKSTLFG